MSLIRADTNGDAGHAKTTTRTVLPPNSRCKIKCKTGVKSVESQQTVLFSPTIVEGDLEFTDYNFNTENG